MLLPCGVNPTRGQCCTDRNLLIGLYFHPALKLGFTHYLLTSLCLKHRSIWFFLNAHAGFLLIMCDKCAQTPSSCSMCAKTFSSVHTDNGCSQCHCEFVVLLFVCPGGPPLRLPEARQECGRRGGGWMSRKESGRKGQARRYLSAQGPHGSCVSVFITL